MLCFPPFCFPLRFFLYLLHPLLVTREEAVMLLRRRYETWLPKADRRRLRHISILLRTATAWLQLYGLLLYSCLRTGTGTCSRMPIRQPWLTQLALAGALPAASISLCCRLVLCWVSKGAPTVVPLYHLNSCEPQNHSKHLAGARGLSGSSVVWQQAGQRTSGGESRTAGWGEYRRALSGMCPQLDKLTVCSPLYVFRQWGSDWPSSLMLFCVLWLMHVLLVRFFFFTPKKFILLLIGYKLSVDNTFSLGFLSFKVTLCIICDFWCLFLSNEC